MFDYILHMYVLYAVCYVHLSSTVHGPPEEALLLTKKATALKDKLVSVTLRCVDCSDSRECTKKLPRT